MKRPGSLWEKKGVFGTEETGVDMGFRAVNFLHEKNPIGVISGYAGCKAVEAVKRHREKKKEEA